MLILWIRRSKADKQTSPTKNDKETLKKHNEDMKKFRLSHPEIENINVKDIIEPDGAILAPVHGVKLAKNVQN
jgi:hypothetical protein